MPIAKTYRRLNRAIRLALSAEADNVLAAAREILATRIRHCNVCFRYPWTESRPSPSCIQSSRFTRGTCDNDRTSIPALEEEVKRF